MTLHSHDLSGLLPLVVCPIVRLALASWGSWIALMVAAITFYGVWKLQGVMMDSEQYYNDPRHPRCKTLKDHRDWLSGFV
jgi:hypothetical protein